MIKMDLSTKQVFLAGFLTWVLTIGSGLITYVYTEGVEAERIQTIENTLKSRKTAIDKLAEVESVVGILNTKVSQQDLVILDLKTSNRDLYKDQVRLKTEVSSTLKVLESLNTSINQLEKSTRELGQFVARLDERSKGVK